MVRCAHQFVRHLMLRSPRCAQREVILADFDIDSDYGDRRQVRQSRVAGVGGVCAGLWTHGLN